MKVIPFGNRKPLSVPAVSGKLIRERLAAKILQVDDASLTTLEICVNAVIRGICSVRDGTRL